MKFLKFINNEKKLTLVKSAKACSVVKDICEATDWAECSLGATDICKIDFASCRGEVYDTCGSNTIDKIGCAYQSDFT